MRRHANENERDVRRFVAPDIKNVRAATRVKAVSVQRHYEHRRLRHVNILITCAAINII